MFFKRCVLSQNKRTILPNSLLMRAAVIDQPGGTVRFEPNHPIPTPAEGSNIVRVRVATAALTNLTKMRALGTHYSSAGAYPLVPGVDGVGRVEGTNERVFFMLPEAPTGGFSEFALVAPKNYMSIPESLDDVTAAAIANPGLSAVGALRYRAKLQPGETVLINGATGSAGTICTQIAKYLGATNVIVTGRKQSELDRLLTLGATKAILFNMDAENGAKEYETALTSLFATHRVHAVVDYLWGPTAKCILAAIAKGSPEAAPVRFVQVGAAAGIESIDLPAAALRSSPVEMMGFGVQKYRIRGFVSVRRDDV